MTANFEITESAWAHLDKFVQQDYLNIGLKVSGCSGFAYDLNPTNLREEQHLCFDNEKYRVKILMMPSDFDKFFKGATLCLKETTFGSQIHIDNPNIQDSCGCGESFTFEGD